MRPPSNEPLDPAPLMPHATQAYPFEMRIFFKLDRLIPPDQFESQQACVVRLSPEGQILERLHPQANELGPPLIDRLKQAGESYVFIDPFDVPEYCWLSWHNVSQQVMERLIGESFSPEDFQTSRPTSSRVPTLDPPGQWPISWGVMF